MTIEIRTATPRDAVGVSRVHASTVRRWWRTLPTGDPIDAEYGELSVWEKYLNGGPWMDPEPCALHLQHVLGSGQWPMVAVDGSGRVLGEIEVMVGPDPAWGLTAHIDVLATDRESQRMGVGTALVAEARHRAIGAGCAAMTTNPEQAAIGFYRRCGLTTEMSRQTMVEIPTAPSGGEALEPMAPGPVPDFRALASWPLVLGRYQTSFATWVKGGWILPGLSDRLSCEEGSFPERRIHYRIRHSPLKRERALVLAWADPSVRTPEALRSVRRQARALGFDTFGTSLDVGDLEACAGLISEIGEETILLGTHLERGAPSKRTLGSSSSRGGGAR